MRLKKISKMDLLNAVIFIYLNRFVNSNAMINFLWLVKTEFFAWKMVLGRQLYQFVKVRYFFTKKHKKKICTKVYISRVIVSQSIV